ncbi:uncharacterized protein LOC143246241 isoform X2 [Tachypleus tridentatus]|uniref:uncharacterized protein LOC143246241 isoform X2 n=1 Tax=Tachypleus tridentatus TaxID=6853 RepID=UPI003FD5AC67
MFKMSDVFKVVHSSSFSGSVNNGFSVDWSADNKIAFCTDKGIHILVSSCSPLELGPTLPEHKYFIPSPKETLSFGTGIERKFFPVNLTTDELNTVMLDHTVSPQTANATRFLAYRLSRWSPLGLAPLDSCLLATLTADHRLQVYQFCKKKIQEVEDLSLKLYGHERKSWKESSAVKGPSAFRILQDRTYSLAAMEITWTENFAVSPSHPGYPNRCCYLIVAMRSGTIIFWEFSRNNNKINIELGHKWNSQLGMVTSLCWQQTGPQSGFLMVGALSGQVIIVPAVVLADETGKNNFQMGQTCHLWEDCDKISVSAICIVKVLAGCFLTVVSKGFHLIGSKIFVSDTSMTIESTGYTAGLHQLTATELIFHQEEILEEVIHPKWSPFGICSSPNRALVCWTQNLITWYDHLVVLEPVKLYIMTTISSEASVENMLVSISKTTTDRQLTSPQQFCDYWDYLDCIRAHFGIEDKPTTALTEILQLEGDKLEQQPVQTLQLIRFLIKVQVMNTNTQDTQSHKKLQVVEDLLLRNHILSIISMFQPKLDSLLQIQHISLILMCDWLFTKYDIVVSEVYKVCGKDAPQNLKDIQARETCPICKKDVHFTNALYGSCSNSHTFGRCSQSLLLCSKTYLRCSSCLRLMIWPAVWNEQEHCAVCSYWLR